MNQEIRANFNTWMKIRASSLDIKRNTNEKNSGTSTISKWWYTKETGTLTSLGNIRIDKKSSKGQYDSVSNT